MIPRKQRSALALLAMLTMVSVSHSQTSSSLGDTARSSRAENEVAASRIPEVMSGDDALSLADQLLRSKDQLATVDTQGMGGLWVSGDVDDALGRLRWIVGAENAKALQLGTGDRVRLSVAALCRAAGIIEQSQGRSISVLADYISANEGLLLVLQLTESLHRYLLHVGRRAPTAAGDVPVSSVLNRDNNFDGRINPIRDKGLKVRSERPPSGVDSLVAINPGVRFLNLDARLFVTPGNIAFHELAEAWARLELSVDYLPHGSCPGAHAIALQREQKLMSQRPLSNAVATGGENLILRADEDRPGLPAGREQR